MGKANYILGMVANGVNYVLGRGADNVGRGPPDMPESVAKAVGAIHPVTGEPMKASGPKRGAYDHGPAEYAKIHEPAPAGTHALLFVPLVLSIAGMASILINNGMKAEGEAMAPSSMSILLLWLIIFASIYCVLIILFYIGKHEAKIGSMKEMQKPNIRKH